MAQHQFKTTIGGQALIEGVMMRGPSQTAVAVRRPDGDITCRVTKNRSWTEKHPLFSLPFVRGAVKLLEAMVVGTEALTYAASFWEEEAEESPAEKIKEFGLVAFSILLAVGIFIVIPSALASVLGRFTSSSFLLNIVDGILRFLFFFIYLGIISRMKEIQRVFEYHGAEHKSIFCYEQGEELTVENVRKFPKEHPRCGTSFLFMVLAISILTLSVFGWPNALVRIILRIVLLPVIAGIAYEINRLVGKYDTPLCRVLRGPGLLIQHFATVREPDDAQIEVAITSLKAVLPREGESDLWT